MLSGKYIFIRSYAVSNFFGKYACASNNMCDCRYIVIFENIISMVRRCGGDATPPSMMVLYFLAPIMKIWVWEILVKVVILANLLVLLILVIMGIIVILVHTFLYCGVRTKKMTL